MLATEASPFISAPVRETFPTGAYPDSPVTRTREEENRAKWQAIIDYKLIEWGCSPGQLEDDGIEVPTGDNILRAIRAAEVYRDKGVSAPDTVVPDGNGGIVLERREEDVVEVLHLWDDGNLEYRRFQGTRLVERRTS